MIYTKPKIRVGDKFGMLTVIARAENSKGGQSKWICKCKCGKTTNPIYGSNLSRGLTISCGCHRQELLDTIGERTKTHGMTDTRLYEIWTFMKVRCYNKNCEAYKYYGGRGITVCDEWKDDFSLFMEWSIKNGYSDDLTIDRIDVNGNYEPGNCRWATQKMQANNTRQNRYITFNGKTMTMKQWSEKIGLRYQTLYLRLKNGWSVEKALTTKSRRNK